MSRARSTARSSSPARKRFSRWFLGFTPGWLSRRRADDRRGREHWDEINDQDGYYVPASLNDWASTFMAHLR